MKVYNVANKDETAFYSSGLGSRYEAEEMLKFSIKHDPDAHVVEYEVKTELEEAREKIERLTERVQQLEAENERLLNSYDAALCETADMHSISKEAEAQVPRWISVEERLPENGSMSICKTLFWCDILQFDAKTKQWFGPHSIHGKGFVTHWMPLPSTEGLHDN